MLRLIRQHLLKQRGHWKPVSAVLDSFCILIGKEQWFLLLQDAAR